MGSGINKAKYILNTVFSKGEKNFNIRLWDGSMVWSNENLSPEFTLIFNNKQCFKRLFFRPDVMIAGEAFINSDLDINGDMYKAVDFADELELMKLSIRDSIRIAYNLITL